MLSKFAAFNCNTYELDGHDELAIINTIKSTQTSDKPVAIICNTIKGKGISSMENKLHSHYEVLNEERYKIIMNELDNIILN